MPLINDFDYFVYIVLDKLQLCQFVRDMVFEKKYNITYLYVFSSIVLTLCYFCCLYRNF